MKETIEMIGIVAKITQMAKEAEAPTETTAALISFKVDRRRRHKSKKRKDSKHKSHRKKSSSSSKKKKKKSSSSSKSSSKKKKRRRSNKDDSDESDSDDSATQSEAESAQSAASPAKAKASTNSDEQQTQPSRTMPDMDGLDEKQKSTIQDYWREKEVRHVDDAPVGPMPLPVVDKHLAEHDYGGALLAGEGSAMAAYLQSGKRIPRRGEIGLTSDEIENYEGAGYVMSGSRHQRMNAVRIRKENQVISAEEKNALLMFAQEASLKKEAEIIGSFKELVAERLRGKLPEDQ
eukprot:jgi/Hompol1/492/HPOL_005329-RA